MQFIHNGVKSKKMYFDGQSMWGAEMAEEVESNYYITPDSNAEVITLPGYMSDDMVLEYDIIHGSTTGDYYVGNLDNDDCDCRYFGPDTWYFDLGDTRQSGYESLYWCDYITKYHIKLWNHGLEISSNGTVLYTDTWSAVTLTSFYPIRINNAISGMKVYGVKLTNGNNVAFDCAVKANGLFDKVSNSYITTTGWTVGSDE